MYDVDDEREHIPYVKLSERFSKARKVHECNMCKLPIKPGVVYYRRVELVDGDFYVWREHTDHMDEPYGY